MKIAVHTPLGGVTGYGRDGEGLTNALAASGHDVHVMPTGVVPPVDPRTAMLLTKHPALPFDLTIVHVWPGAFVPHAGRRRSTAKLVGWTMWEQYDPDPEWTESFAAATAEMDLLLVYDEITMQSLSPIAQCAVGTLQGGYDPASYAPAERDWHAPVFRFGMMGDLASPRKDPFRAIRAFQLLKERHGEAFSAELHLKSSSAGIPPSITAAYPWLTLHVGVWPQPRVQEFYAGLHCLVAPSRGEGKNVPALEALTTGIPVIASDVGGHRAWLRPEWGWPVPTADELYEGRMWPRVEVEPLAEAMWEAYSNRQETRRRGETGQRNIPSMCSWDRVSARLLDRAQQIPRKETTNA